MTEKQWKQVEEQLPTGAKILRTYNAFENGELRIIVQLPGERFETRYIIHFEGEDVKLEHRP
jgi:hypothetical protein